MIDLLDIPHRISQLLGESHEAPTAIHSVSRTDRGDRLTNDDRCFRDDNKGIYLLVDGIGGHAGGRLASMIATATITKSLPTLFLSLATAIQHSPIIIHQ